MGKIKIVPTKLICSIPGCKNTNTLNATRNGEMRNSVNICPECIRELCRHAFTGQQIEQDTKRRTRKPAAAKETALPEGDDEEKEGDNE